jgi:alkylated DNA repair protein (DNA oxidative demethylase)
MTMHANTGTGDLFDGALPEDDLGTGAKLLRGFAEKEAPAFIGEIDEISKAALFRNMTTPGGRKISVAMTNCGDAGWVSDKRGYRYDRNDPMTNLPWPPLPSLFSNLAKRAAVAAGFVGFMPDSCLINRYAPGTRLSLHQDRDERDFSAPIVSVSLGLAAVFLFGGQNRADRPIRLRLENGDVVVWGGPARLTYHGIAPLAKGRHALTGACRLNLTFRKAF